MLTRAEECAAFVPYEPAGLFSPVQATSAVGPAAPKERVINTMSITGSGRVWNPVGWC